MHLEDWPFPVWPSCFHWFNVEKVTRVLSLHQKEFVSTPVLVWLRLPKRQQYSSHNSPSSAQAQGKRNGKNGGTRSEVQNVLRTANTPQLLVKQVRRIHLSLKKQEETFHARSTLTWGEVGGHVQWGGWWEGGGVSGQVCCGCCAGCDQWSVDSWLTAAAGGQGNHWRRRNKINSFMMMMIMKVCSPFHPPSFLSLPTWEQVGMGGVGCQGIYFPPATRCWFCDRRSMFKTRSL